jgi:hypothetical protein
MGFVLCLYGACERECVRVHRKTIFAFLKIPGEFLRVSQAPTWTFDYDERSCFEQKNANTFSPH